MASIPHGHSFVFLGGEDADKMGNQKAYKFMQDGLPQGRWVLVPFGLLPDQAAGGAVGLGFDREVFPDPPY